MGESRDTMGRFRQGHPGGPGRPKGQTLSAELRRQGDAEQIARRLLAIIADPAANTRDVLQAIALYSDRTEGRPTARLEIAQGGGDRPPEGATEAELKEWAVSFRAKALGESK